MRKLGLEREEFAEWQYRIQERLGILCGRGIPTWAEARTARREADGWVERQPLRSCLGAFAGGVEPVLAGWQEERERQRHELHEWTRTEYEYESARDVCTFSGG